MTVSPPPTLYHRWMGWHAPALRRVAILALFGLAVTLALMPIVPWQSRNCGRRTLCGFLA
jgi:hypothetical protein